MPAAHPAAGGEIAAAAPKLSARPGAIVQEAPQRAEILRQKYVVMFRQFGGALRPPDPGQIPAVLLRRERHPVRAVHAMRSAHAAARARQFLPASLVFSSRSSMFPAPHLGNRGCPRASGSMRRRFADEPREACIFRGNGGRRMRYLNALCQQHRPPLSSCGTASPRLRWPAFPCLPAAARRLSRSAWA